MAKQTDTVDSHGRTIEQERAKDIPAVHAYDANRVRTIGRLRLSPRRWLWVTRFDLCGSMEPKALEDGATFEPFEQAA
jgi:hypothetical protein